MKQLFRSKALSLLYSYPGCPIIYSIARWMTRVSENFGDPILESMGSVYMQQIFAMNQDYYNKNKSKFHKEVGDATRNLMFKLYGVTIDHQIAIEKYFDDKDDYDEIDFPILTSYMPEKFSKFYDAYTEDCEVTDVDEIAYTVKHFPYNKKFDIYEDEPSMFLNHLEMMSTPEKYEWYTDCMNIKYDSNKSVSVPDVDNSVNLNFDESDELDFDVVDYDERIFNADGSLKNVCSNDDSVIETNRDLESGSFFYTPILNKFLTKIHDKVDRDLWGDDYMKNNSSKSLVHRLWTKIKVFGKKLRPGGVDLFKVFYETPAENIEESQGAEMQRNNRTMNSKRSKISNRRNANRNNVNLPKRKIKKQIRPRGNRAINYSRAPAALGTQLRTKNAKFIRSPDGSIRVVHREPLGVQNGTTAFALTQFSTNPGLAATFPWLSKIAQNFETYKFNKLNVEYITSVGSNVGGSICIAPDYNSADAQPTSLQQMEQYMDAWRDVFWENGVCRINPKGMGALGPMRYIRASALASNLDIKTYDVCNIFVGTSGITTDANASQIGELWVNYDVDLCIPNSFISSQTEPSGGFGYVQSVLGTGISTTNLFGSATTSSGPLIVTNLMNTITVAGVTIGDNYVVTYSGSATSVSGAISAGTYVGCTENSGTASFGAGASASTTVNLTATATTMSFVLTPAGTWATVTNMVCSAILVLGT